MRSFLRSAPWGTAAIFIAGVLASVGLSARFDQRLRQQHLAEEGARAKAHLEHLDNGLSSLISLNEGLAAHLAASHEVDRREFETYVEVFQRLRGSDGLRAIGYAPRVKLKNLDAFERFASADYPDYAVLGVAGGPYVHPLLHLAPPMSADVQLRGLDQAGIPERRQAMQAAERTGRTTVTLPHFSPMDVRVIIAFTPVYEPVSMTKPGERPDVSGFVESIIATDDMVRSMLGSRFSQLFDIAIFDGTARRSVLYADPGALGTTREAVARETLTFGGRRWTVVCYAKREMPNAGWVVRSAIVLLGTALSALLAWGVHRVRARVRRGRREEALAERLHKVFEHHPFAVYYLDTSRCFVNVNDKALVEFGLTRAELVGMRSEQLIAPEKRELGSHRWQQVLRGQAVSYDTVVLGPGGARFDANLVLVPMMVEGHVAGVLGIAENISERQLRMSELRESRRMLQAIIDNVPQHIFWKDRAHRYLGCNNAFSAYMHREREALLGRTDHELMLDGAELNEVQIQSYRDEAQQVMDTGEPMIGMECVVLQRDGTRTWARTSRIPLRDEAGEVTGVLGVSEDITERKQFELRLQEMAHHDSLTGLPNRAFLLSQLEQAMRRAHRSGALLAVLYFDIDRFKTVNDTWGHDIGDRVIQEFAFRVTSIVRESDIVGRIGGDEFVMVSEGLFSRNDALALAGRLIGCMRTPFRVREDLALDLSSSIGIAFLEDGVDAEEILRRADQAMFAAKRRGRDCVHVHGAQEFAAASDGAGTEP